MVPNTKDHALAEAAFQAKDVIYKVVKFESCLTNYDGSALNEYSAPDVTFPNNNYSPIMSKTLSHTRNSCLSVSKIQGWTLFSKDKLSFEVIFLASDTGEAAKNKYEFQQLPDGIWQLKRRFY